jgi:glutamyl-tRNA reductase
MQSMIPPSLRLLVVGLNHRTAPLALRENLAFSPDVLQHALADFQHKFPGTEVVILSTCNRVELYVTRPIGADPTVDALAEFLAHTHQLPAENFKPHIYHHEDRRVVEHLFAVASSLDSMVVGETQILAQVKQAYQAACHAGTVDKVFHALFQRSLAAAKDVHDRTQLSAGRLSVASVAVDLVQTVFDRFDDKTVLCVGAGEMAGLMLNHFKALAPRQILLTNRSLERAQDLATQVGGTARPLENLLELLVEADIIVTSTGAQLPVITATAFKGLLKSRRYRPVVIVDIAVPRDVEEAVGKLNNVYLYNIDDLQQVSAVNLEKRQKLVDESHQLLVSHVEDFLYWFAARDIGPLVKALYEQCHAIAHDEVQQLFARHPEYDEAQRKDVERLTHRIIGKILHDPVSQITQQAEATARPMLTAALKKLFALNADRPAEPAPNPDDKSS